MSDAIDQITLATLQTAYPLLTANQIADAPRVITAVSAMIANRYPLAIRATDFTETHTPGPSREIALRKRPVIQVYRIRTAMSPVLTILRSTAARRAFVQVNTTGEGGAQTPTGITLGAQVNGSAETPSILLFSNYTTLSSLVTQINTIGPWSASYATGQGDMDTVDIEPSQGPKPITASSTTGASLWAYTTEFDDWSINQRQGRITTNRQMIEAYEFPGVTFGADPRVASLQISYQAGHITTPPDVERAVIVAIGDVIEAQAKAGPVSSEKSDDYSYTINASQVFSAVVQHLLSPYMDRRPS